MAARTKTTAKAERGPAAVSSTVRFPGESAAYRRARDELLAAEAALRAQIESVAVLRRRLPLGGEVPVDYSFEGLAAGLGENTTETVKLSELFATPEASLAIYSFMYGPEMDAPCPICVSILDALDGEAPHIAQRVNFAVVAKSPIDRIRDFAQARGWRHLRLLSSFANAYNREYHGETESGAQLPCLNVFQRRDGRVRHFWASELLFTPSEPGMDHRHVDLIWPLWNLLDFTPEGRGTDWSPKLQYGD